VTEEDQARKWNSKGRRSLSEENCWGGKSHEGQVGGEKREKKKYAHRRGGKNVAETWKP